MAENKEEKTVQVSFRSDEDFKRRLRTKTTDAGLSLDLALKRLATAYLDGKPEAEAIAAGNDELLASTKTEYIEAVRRICAQQRVPLWTAVNHALALWIDYQEPGAVMVKIPVFLKRPVAWMQTRLRTKAEAEVFYGLLQKIIEFSKTEVEGVSPQSGSSTKSDKTG